MTTLLPLLEVPQMYFYVNKKYSPQKNTTGMNHMLLKWGGMKATLSSGWLFHEAKCHEMQPEDVFMLQLDTSYSEVHGGPSFLGQSPFMTVILV